MIKYYSITACSPCREKDMLYRQAYAYMRKQKRLDFQTIALTSTEALREYAREVKPYRKGRDSLPMVFDDDKKEELIFDEKGRVQSRGVLRAKKQAVKEQAVSGRRRRDTKEAQPSDAQELAQTR